MATPLSTQGLFDTLKREGVNPLEYRSWRTHERDDETGKVFGPVNGVVIHHTAGTNSLGLVYDGTSELPGPLCHTHLSKTGVASMISAGRANHAGGFAQNAHDAVVAESSVHPYPDADEPVDGNDHYYGIEIENLGNGTDPYPWVQYVKAVKWATAICRAHGWSHNSVIGHKEGTRRKIDPKGPFVGPDGNSYTFTMNGFRAHVRDALALPAGVWPTEEDDMPTLDEYADAVLDRDRIPNNGPDRETNPAVPLVTAMSRLEILARRTDVEIDALAAKIDALAVGGVDLDLLAAKVADLLHQRLAG